MSFDITDELLGSSLSSRYQTSKRPKEKERRELKKEAQQELHYLKLDAVIYALGNVGEHKDEFERVYRTRLKNQLSEREDLQEIINQNS